MIRKLALIALLGASFTAVSAKEAREPESLILGRISLTENLDEFKSSLFTETKSLQVNNGEVLDFSSFIDTVKQNHPAIVSADLSKQIASSKRLEAQGAFDPSINSQNFFNRFNSSSTVGDAQEAFTSNTSLDFLTGYGAQFGLGAKFAQGDIRTPISPTGETGEYFIRAQIPLLRGAIYNSKFVKEKSSRLNEVIADYLLFRTKLKTLDSGARAYWDWIASKKILDVETRLLNIVNGQVGFVRQQADLGNIAQISVVEAQREAQKRQGKVSSSTRVLQASSLDLSKSLWTDKGTPYAIPKSTQVPEGLILPSPLIKDLIDEAKLNALVNRPEFKTLELARDISNLDRKLAKNQMLPKLDAFINSGFQTGQDSIGPSIEAGVNLSLPLRNRAAGGRKQQAELAIKQLNLQERQLIQNVFLEIEDTASALDTSYARYLAAGKGYELSLKLEEGENERFKLGDSTLFLVIRRQRATVGANIELIKTIVDYHKAKYKFKLIQGELI